MGWCSSEGSDPDIAQFATLCRDSTGRTFFETQPAVLSSDPEAGPACQISWCPGAADLCAVRLRNGCVLCRIRDEHGIPTPEIVASWAKEPCAVDCHGTLPVVAVRGLVTFGPKIFMNHFPCQVVTRTRVLLFNTHAASDKPIAHVELLENKVLPHIPHKQSSRTFFCIRLLSDIRLVQVPSSCAWSASGEYLVICRGGAVSVVHFKVAGLWDLAEVSEWPEMRAARAVCALEGDHMAVGCEGMLSLGGHQDAPLLWEAAPEQDDLDDEGMVDLRGRLTCSAKDEQAVPQIFQLPQSTLSTLVGAADGIPSSNAAAVEVKHGSNTIDVSALPRPSEEIQGSEASGSVSLLSLGSRTTRKIVVPVLSPDVLSFDQRVGALLVGGGGNRILAGIADVAGDAPWAAPIVLDKEFGNLRGAVFLGEGEEASSKLHLLLATPQKMKVHEIP